MASITLVDHIIIGDNNQARELASFFKMARRGYLILSPSGSKAGHDHISVINSQPQAITNTGIPKDTFKITDQQGRIFRSRSITFADPSLIIEKMFHPQCTPRRDWETYQMLMTSELESINVDGLFFLGITTSNHTRYLYSVLESKYHDDQPMGDRLAVAV